MQASPRGDTTDEKGDERKRPDGNFGSKPSQTPHMYRVVGVYFEYILYTNFCFKCVCNDVMM